MKIEFGWALELDSAVPVPRPGAASFEDNEGRRSHECRTHQEHAVVCRIRQSARAVAGTIPAVDLPDTRPTAALAVDDTSPRDGRRGRRIDRRAPRACRRRGKPATFEPDGHRFTARAAAGDPSDRATEPVALLSVGQPLQAARTMTERLAPEPRDLVIDHRPEHPSCSMVFARAGTSDGSIRSSGWARRRCAMAIALAASDSHADPVQPGSQRILHSHRRWPRELGSETSPGKRHPCRDRHRGSAGDPLDHPAMSGDERGKAPPRIRRGRPAGTVRSSSRSLARAPVAPKWRQHCKAGVAREFLSIDIVMILYRRPISSSRTRLSLYVVRTAFSSNTPGISIMETNAPLARVAALLVSR